MKSLYALVLKEGEEVEKLTQGEIKMAPAKGVERKIGGIKTVDEGCGCEIWDRRARAKFAPAEEPVIMILEGEIERVFKT